MSFDAKNPSKRYRVDIEVKYFNLTQMVHSEGTIIDINLHGGVLIDNKNFIFNKHHQLQFNLPLTGCLDLSYGEFMRLTAKTRNVFMGGNKVGFSWEYLSENQHIILTKFLTNLVSDNFNKN